MVIHIQAIPCFNAHLNNVNALHERNYWKPFHGQVLDVPRIYGEDSFSQGVCTCVLSPQLAED